MWCVDEAKTEEELARRLRMDFLCHCNHDGIYADFHSLRHWFITGLARAGVSPKMAQTLARHSDIRLTLGLYSHVELPDCSAAIESLPALPSGEAGHKGDGGGGVGGVRKRNRGLCDRSG